MANRDAVPPEGYHPTYAALLAALQDGTEEWLAEIGEPSEEAIVWQPWLNGSSIGAQVLHLASVEVSWLHSYCLGQPKTAERRSFFMDDERDVDEEIWPVPYRKPWNWYVDLLAEVRQQTLEAVKQYPDPHLVVPNQEGDRTYRWVLSHVVQHESYHFGQAVLLDMMFKRNKKAG